MALARTSNRVWRTSRTVGTLTVRSERVRRQRWSARTIFRQFLAAVVNGSDHPSWRTSDVSTHLALLQRREQDRLLDSGRVTTTR
jgi:hypothetical protein